jgi:LuxR family transcriptional regulator, maltose regulon positive regulatory protein
MGGNGSSAVVASDGHAGIERFFGLPIVRSKLMVPSLPSGFTPRPRLVDALMGSSCPCCVVQAPAGYGKTTAIVEALAAPTRTDVAWLSIDAYESTELSFWAHLAASIDRIRPGLLELFANWRASTRADEAIKLAASLVSAIDSDDDLVIVLDDLHQVTTQTLWDQIAFFLDRLPRGVRTIVSSRSVPPLPVERWQSQGRANTVDERVLRFNTDEAAELISRVCDNDLTADEVGKLVALSEGWAIGLVFEALAWKKPSASGGSSADCTRRPTRNVIKYLATEVFERLDSEDRQFLLDISVLKEFDNELCCRVTGEPDAGVRLQSLQVAKLFLVPVDDDGRRFRFHHLFRELLVQELDRRDSRRRTELHRRCAEAAGEMGLVPLRIHHLLEAGEKAAAFDLIVSHAVRKGSLVAARELIASFPNEFVHEDPARMLDFAMIHAYAGNWKTSESWCDRVESVLPDGGGPLRARLELQRAWEYGGRGDTQAAFEALEQSFAAGAALDDGPLAALYRTSPARLHVFLTRDLEAAEFWLEESRRLPPSFVIAHYVSIPALTAFLRLWAGDLAEAERLARQVLAAADDLNVSPGIPNLEALLILCDVYIETGRLQEAASVLERTKSLAAQIAPPVYLAQVAFRGIEFTAATKGPIAAAEEALVAGRDFEGKSPGDTLAHDFTARQAYWLLSGGRIVDASRLIQTLDPSPLRAILKVKLEGLEKHHLPRVSDLEDRSRWTGFERLEADLICDSVDGHRALPQIVERSRGFVWTVVKQGPPLLQRLSQLQHDEDSAATMVLDNAMKFNPAFWQSSEVATTGHLTKREQTLLQLLPSHLSYSEIASELYLSVNTVKANLKALYRKLGASSRSEAVQRAGLFAPIDQKLLINPGANHHPSPGRH